MTIQVGSSSLPPFFPRHHSNAEWIVLLYLLCMRMMHAPDLCCPLMVYFEQAQLSYQIIYTIYLVHFRNGFAKGHIKLLERFFCIFILL